MKRIIQLAAVYLFCSVLTTFAQTYYYTLLGDSLITEDCKACGRPTIPQPMRGEFTLQVTNQNPISTQVIIRDIHFYSGDPSDPLYLVKGSGYGEIFGEVAMLQRITLNLTILRKYSTNRELVFTNTTMAVVINPPMVNCELAQTEEDMFQFYTLKIVAAPMHEILFSTESGFTSGNSTIRGSGGDILSNKGKVIKAKNDLIKALRLVDPPETLNIDALDILPGGIILFSFNQNVNSQTAGWIEEGDVVTDLGDVAYRNTELLSRMGFMPPTPALGLDGIQVLNNGEVLFSTRYNAFSEKLGQFIQHGDILSNQGYIYRKNKDLLAAFQPADPNQDYGLDAFYVWQTGEIWFSTASGFTSRTLGSIMAGDLLSDKGYIVFRNLELMSKFQPLEDLADFGLDGLFIVTDLTAITVPPRIVFSKFRDGVLTLKWQGQGRIYRVERANDVLGPFMPVMTTTSTQFEETIDTALFPQKMFYRIRQW